MKSYSVNNIRNIAIAGHTGKGKTALSEAMFYVAGITDRLGRVADGNTIMDYDAEEKKRKCSISSATASFEWRDTKINVLDAPGKFDFAGGMAEAMRAADCAVIVTSAGSGIDVGLEKAIKAADQRNIAKFFAITKVDSENRDFYKTFEALKEELGNKLCPVVVPYMNGPVCEAFVNLCSNKAFKYPNGRPVEIDIPSDDNILAMRAALEEAVATVDEELMEKFFEDPDSITVAELKKALRKATIENQIVPMLCGTSYRNKGVQLLLDAIIEYMPAPTDVANIKGVVPGTEEEQERPSSDDEPFAALAFKIATDPFVGKLCFFRVYSGTVDAGSYVLNACKNNKERLGRILQMHANSREDIEKVYSGDIAAAVGLKNTTTGDTLCDEKHPIILESMEFPEPVIRVAIEPKTKAGQEKMGIALAKLAEEDPTFKTYTDEETGQTIIAGMGELHLEIIVDRLLREFKVEANVGKPQVSYREAIRQTVNVDHKYARQSGGKGQYGHVKMTMEPLEEGKGYEFVNAIVGGAIPKEYIPAVDAGVQGAMQNGILAGYNVVDVKVTLTDGSYHEVDSSEMAFKIAASMAFKDGMRKADPVIKEPIMLVNVIVPDDYLGFVIGDLSSRRGLVKSQEVRSGGVTQVTADVPHSEMFGYATDLRSGTQGRGQYTMEPSHYSEVPKNVQETIISARAKAE